MVPNKRPAMSGHYAAIIGDSQVLLLKFCSSSFALQVLLLELCFSSSHLSLFLERTWGSAFQVLFLLLEFAFIAWLWCWSLSSELAFETQTLSMLPDYVVWIYWSMLFESKARVARVCFWIFVSIELIEMGAFDFLLIVECTGNDFHPNICPDKNFLSISQPRVSQWEGVYPADGPLIGRSMEPRWSLSFVQDTFCPRHHSSRGAREVSMSDCSPYKLSHSENESKWVLPSGPSMDENLLIPKHFKIFKKHTKIFENIRKHWNMKKTFQFGISKRFTENFVRHLLVH